MRFSHSKVRSPAAKTFLADDGSTDGPPNPARREDQREIALCCDTRDRQILRQLRIHVRSAPRTTPHTTQKGRSTNHRRTPPVRSVSSRVVPRAKRVSATLEFPH